MLEEDLLTFNRLSCPKFNHPTTTSIPHLHKQKVFDWDMGLPVQQWNEDLYAA